MASGCGRDAFELLRDVRRKASGETNVGGEGHGVIAIAETDFSRFLDDKRREVWRLMDEPERPEHPPQRYLQPFVPSGVEGRGFASEPTEYTGACSRPAYGVDPEEWSRMSHEEQKLRFAEQHRRDAEAQVAFEAEALAEYERRKGDAR